MSLSLKPLDAQVMVITGASSGIGRVTARMAAAAGATVLLVARDEPALASAVAEIRDAGGTADLAVADVGDAGAVQAAAARAIERFGRIDTWVNNAGTAIYARLADTPADEHERMVRTNYWGVVNASLAALPHLKAGGGALVTVGSVASDMASPVMGAYAATKHAAKAWVEALRMELGEEGAPVSVSLVKPAGIDTPIARRAANHMPGEAQIPPPVYDPELVARAILDCATRPRREITVGGVGRAQVLFSQHFPALYERLAPYAARAFNDRDRAQPGPAALFAPAQGGQERSGEHDADRRRRSLYTAAALHPRATTAAVLAGGVVAAGLLVRSLRRAA